MNQNNDVVYVTPEGLQQLEEELAYLTTEKREELSQKLEAAIAQGDLKENADYHDAKEEQGFVEARIR
ncbi:MAG: transcription elongation factor GreA, partial [Candidatus Promineifilaceae bacterium]